MAQTVRSGIAIGAALLAVATGLLAHAATGGNSCAQMEATPHLQVMTAAGWRSSGKVQIPGSAPTPLRATDEGVAAANSRLDRILLLLKAPEDKEHALDSLMQAQQTPGACAFHRWLTPAQFADQFGNDSAEVSMVTEWLKEQGFGVAPLPAGRGWIEFSGTAGQVEQAFGTRVRRFATERGVRFVAQGEISVPAAFAGIVRGLVSLDGAESAPAITDVQLVGSQQNDAITPARLSELFQLRPDPARGRGQTIAIVAKGGVDPDDVKAFRFQFGLPVTELEESGDWKSDQAERALATLEAEWAGVAAPAARIVVGSSAGTLATDGVDLALAELVDRATANTLVVGFAGCEAAMRSTHQAFYRAVYRQAAAEGISVISAAGDMGAAACDVPGSLGPVSTGYGVNALASTEWNTAVSAVTAGPDGGFEAWSPVEAASPGFAAGGGGSKVHARPAWQPAAESQTSSAGRLLPDVSVPVFGNGGRDALAFCFGGSGGNCVRAAASGSGAAAAVFAGVSAVLAEKYGPQGNLSSHLYALNGDAVTDVRSGTARLSCERGSTDCGVDGTIGFDAGPGFDQATGLGVPAADALVNAWAAFQAAGSTASNVTLTVSPIVANATYNPSAQITLTASVSGSGAIPTGTVQFFDKALNKNLGTGAVTLDASGFATVTVNGGLATGGNNLTALYSGDSVYAASNSQPVTVTIQPSTTSMTTVPSTTTPAPGASFTVTVTMTVGDPPAGATPPSGKVTMNLDGLPASTATLVTAGGATSATFTLTGPATTGSHNLQAIYSGDTNYQASVSPTVTITSSKGATVTTLTATPSTLTPNTPITLTATVAPLTAPLGTPATLTGTIAFYDGTVLLGTGTLASNTATLSNVTLSTAKAHLVTAVYSGNANWATSTSNPVSLTALLLTDTVTLTVNPAVAGPGQVVTLTATVTPSVAPEATAEQNPTGNVVFYSGTTIVATVPLSAGPNNTGVATLLNATLPPGTLTLTAFYVGDLYYAAGTSNPVSITVQDFSITPAGTNPPTNLDVIKGQSGSASFVVTALGGYNGQVQVVCAVPTQDDMTCATSPQQVTPTGTVTFTVQTYLTGGPTAKTEPMKPLWPGAAGGTALAALFLLVAPFGRHGRRLSQKARRGGGMLLLLLGIGLTGMGCTSVSGAAANPSTGTPLGVATLKITASAFVNNTVVSHSVYLTVNVLPPK